MYRYQYADRAFVNLANVLMFFAFAAGNLSAQEPELHDLIETMRTVIADGADAASDIVGSPSVERERNPYIYWKPLASLYHSVSTTIFDTVTTQFESGLTLERIQQRTGSCLTWSEWPKMMSVDSASRPMGFDNVAAGQISDNSLHKQVVLIYRNHEVAADLQLTYLQTSFCFPKVRDEFFWRSVDMAVIVRSDSDIRLTRLQYPLGSEYVVGNAPGLFPLLLGFVQIPESIVPLILVGQKPSGTQRNCSVYVYIWSEVDSTWQFAKLKDFDHVTDLYFDGASSELRKYSGYSRDEQGHSGQPILDSVIHVPTFLRKHKEYFKEQTGIDLFK